MCGTTSPRWATSTGTSFAVWAPNAQAVRVKGDFNGWDGRQHAMRSMGASGVWELFIPGVERRGVYKYEILGQDGYWVDKADPHGPRDRGPAADRLAGGGAPATSSATPDWMQPRAARDPHNGADERL